MATQRRVEFQGTFDVQEILNTINTLQNRLSKIQLDDSSVRRFERTFSDLKKRAQEIDAEIKQGFTSTSQINNFNNHLQKLGQQMEILRGEIGRIDTSFSNLKLSPALQKQFENLKNSANTMFDAYASQISNVESKISSFASKTGISLELEDVSELARAISSQEELIKLQQEKVQQELEAKKVTEDRISILEQERQKVIDNKQAKEVELQTAREVLEIAEKSYAEAQKVPRKQRDAVQYQEIKKNTEDARESFRKLTDEINKSENRLAEINQEIVEGNRKLDGTSDRIREINRLFQILSGDSSGLDDDAAAAAKEFSDLHIKVSKLEKQLEEANAELQKFKDLQSRKVTTGLESSIDDINNFKKGVDKASESTGEMADNMERLNKQDEFFNNLKARATAMFGLTNAFIYMNRFIRESVQTIKELDAAFTEIAVVTNMTTEQLWESFDTYNEMAQRLGTTTVDAIETSALYYQQGLDTVEVLELTEETMKMARIAGMDYAEATDRMTAALRGFKLEMSEASRVNDVFSALAAESAVDTDELSSALTRTASIAASAGMELETTSAFLSQMIETTREAPENLGTAMKTIIARFQELKTAVNDSVEIDGELVEVNKVDTALQSVGVQLRDSLTGQFRDLDDVFLELASKWDTLDRNTQRYVATIAAGSRQQSRFIAMMDNYERTLELVDIAQNSNGASADQFAKTLDSVEAKLNNLKSSFEELVGTLVKSEFVKGILDGLNNILQFINGIAENGEIAFAAFATIAILTIKKIINNLISGARTASGLIGAVRDSFLGNHLEEVKKTNKKSIEDLEDRIRKSSISDILASKISQGINQGATQASASSTGTKSHGKNPIIMTEGQVVDKQYLTKVRDRLKSGGGLSNEDRALLKQAGYNLGQGNTALLQNVEATLNNSTAMGKFTAAMNKYGATISSVGSMIASGLTAFGMANAASTGESALKGATLGSGIGSLVGMAGYAIPGVGAILGPLTTALGGTIGTWAGKWIGEWRDNERYGIGSESNIKKLEESYSEISSKYSKAIEENNSIIELGEEYLELSEKINLTNAEKERLEELNGQLISQIPELGSAYSEEINSNQILNKTLEDRIKLLKEENAEMSAVMDISSQQLEYAKLSRESQKAIEDLKYDASTPWYAEAARWISPTSYALVSNNEKLIQSQQFGYFEGWQNWEPEKFYSVSYEDYLKNTSGVQYTEDQFNQILEEIISQREKFVEVRESYRDISSNFIDLAFEGLNADSYLAKNKSFISDIIQATISDEEIDSLVGKSPQEVSDQLKEWVDEVFSEFNGELKRISKDEQEVFSNALNMIGLFRNAEGEVILEPIKEYLESELGETRGNNLFELIDKQIPKEKINELAKKYDDLNEIHQEFIDNWTGENEQLVKYAYANIAMQATDWSDSYQRSFKEEFEKLVNNEGNKLTNDQLTEALSLIGSASTNSAYKMAELTKELIKLGVEEDQATDLANSMGSAFDRSGTTAAEVISELESHMENLNSLVEILSANAEGALSLQQFQKLNELLSEQGKGIIPTSAISATPEGMKINDSKLAEAVDFEIEDQENSLEMWAKHLDSLIKYNKGLLEYTDNLEEEKQLKADITDISIAKQSIEFTIAQRKAKQIEDNLKAEAEERQRVSDLIEQYKDYIAEMDRYYNIQRHLLELQNQQKNFELDMELAQNPDDIANAYNNQILNLTEQLELSKFSSSRYASELSKLAQTITQNYGKYLQIDENGVIQQNVDEMVKLRKQLLDASEDQVLEIEQEIEIVNDLQSEYENLYDLTNEALQEQKQLQIEIKELEDSRLDEIIELQQKIRDVVLENMQTELNATKEKYDKIKQEDQKYLNSLQKNINKRKQLQQDQDQDEEISTIQNRIALLSRDTSGIYSKEIEDLQEELDGLLRDKENNTLDRMYEEEQEKTQIVSDELDRRYEYLQNQLELEQQLHTISNQKVNELMQTDFETILKWLQTNDQTYQGMLQTEQEAFNREYTEKINHALGAQQSINTNLEDEKEKIIGQFDGIITGGIDVYIDALNRADNRELNITVDTKNIDIALEEIHALESEIDSFNKKQAKEDLDKLLLDIKEAARLEGRDSATVKGLRDQYKSLLEFYRSSGGEGDDKNDAGIYNDVLKENYQYSIADYYAMMEGNSYYSESAGKTKTTSSASNVKSSNPKKVSFNKDTFVYYGSHGLEYTLFNAGTYEIEKIYSEGGKKRIKFKGYQNPYLYDDIVKKGTFQYATGGIVDYTGPAWVDGTKSRPEAFLSAADTDNIAKLRDILTKVFDSNGASSNSDSSIQNTGDTYYEFHIKVDELGEGYDAEQMMKDMEKYIVQKANYRKVTNISRR